MLPPGVLERRAAQRSAAQAGSGQGARRSGNRRGRPLPARPGKPLERPDRPRRHAARRRPWQTLRRAQAPERTGIIVRSSDMRVRRYEERSDRLVIFCVDASGSAAMARLGEAKGAVELLLAEAYARRDHVALIAFRGRGRRAAPAADPVAGAGQTPPRRSARRRRHAAGRRVAGGPRADAARRTVGVHAGARASDGRPRQRAAAGRRGPGAGDGRCGPDGAPDRHTTCRRRRHRHGDAPRGELSALAGLMGLPYLALPRAMPRR